MVMQPIAANVIHAYQQYLYIIIRTTIRGVLSGLNRNAGFPSSHSGEDYVKDKVLGTYKPKNSSGKDEQKMTEK